MKCVYVYYRIDPGQAGLAAVRNDALLKAMAVHCSQPPQQLNRCDDPTVWMEVYEGIADFATFAAALDLAVLNFGCAAYIQGERHLECFSTIGNEPLGSRDPRS